MTNSTNLHGEVTIRDVAREAGVSTATVSRVVNGTGRVSPEKQARVVQVMGRLGYVMNQQARSLAGGKSQVIGLLAAEISHPFVGEVIKGIEDELAALQFDLLLYTTHRQKMRESLYVATLTRGLADGLLLIVPRNIDSYVETLQQQRFPHVVIANQASNGASNVVTTQYYQGVYDAISYLIRLGHRRIGFVMGIQELPNAHDQLAAYRQALRDHDIEPEESLIVCGEYIQHVGFKAARTLLALPTPPTAIFAANDLSAFGAMEAARSCGLRIPEDLSIMGCDDLPEAAHAYPPLTSMRYGIDEIGRLATRLLLEVIAHPDAAPRRIALPMQLIERGSCKRLG
ncbi:MAG TPA: LacI family DNA-binding transcriptional regulator [Ktedonobacteraceae bacterium]|nr:LacI family DNA-binding transcriptional regulator [Ktedonobacteraceae bacterium]